MVKPIYITAMKRFLFTTVLVLAAVAAVQADAYRDALSEYLKKKNIAQEQEIYVEMITPLAKQLFPDDEKATSALAEYFSSQLVDDIIDLNEPVYRKHMSIADLQELGKLYSDPRMADIEKRSAEIASAMQKSEEFAAYMQNIQTAFMEILSGNPMPEDMHLPAEISPAYYETFMQYYKNSRMDEMMNTSMRTVFEAAKSMLQKNNLPDIDKKVQDLTDYSVRNIPNVVAMVMHKTITMDDLRLLSEVAAKPCAQRAAAAAVELSENPLQLGLQVIGKMADWMDVHYPQYASPFREMVKMMENL